MRTCLIIILFLFSGVASAQRIQITNRESGAEILVYPRKIKAVVNMDGEFFEGRVKALPDNLLIGNQRVPYKEIGFLEVKKLNGRSFLSQPLKWIGGGLGIIGAGISSIALEDDESPGVVGASLAMMGGGLLLFSLGKKAEPSENSKITLLHTRDWEFSYLPPAEF